jgi:phage baseplate assembly protein W
MEPVPRKARYFGYNAPFIAKDGHILTRQDDERLVKNDLLQLLHTIPGERIMSPDFGVNLRNFPFEPADAAAVGALQQEISAKIRQFEPRVIVKDVRVTAAPDANLVGVQVVVALITSPLSDFLLELKLPTGNQSSTVPAQI